MAAVVAGIAASVVVGCGSQPAEPAKGDVVGSDVPRDAVGRVETSQLVGGLNAFGLDYLRLLSESSPAENVVLSPLSIGMAFGMAEAGARGETVDQIADVFGFPSTGKELHKAFNALDQRLADSGRSTVRLANRMFPRLDFELVEEFVATLGAQYGAPLERLDFAGEPKAARDRINAWVSKRTEKRIPELLAPGFIDATTVLVLVNALYLEAKWSQPFGKYPTERAPFTTLDGSTVQARLMHNAELRTRFAVEPGYQAVELPYGNGELSMLALVPDRGRLEEFERGLDAARLAQIDTAMRKGVVDLFLPRWSSDFDVDLDETLPELGLTLPFNGGDFTGISPDNPFIGEGVHAAMIEVDEHGTVAAAATGLGFQVSGPPQPDAVIRADRPFLYLIRDTETGTVLFAGRVVDPTT
jgi:serpin B